MSEESHVCLKCNSLHGYPDGNLWVCSECFNEWVPQKQEVQAIVGSEHIKKFVDANGVQLQSGDTVATIKDLKLGKETLKSGTKVKNIRLLSEPIDDHDISCKIPGHGSMYLKCSVVKKLKS